MARGKYVSVRFGIEDSDSFGCRNVVLGVGLSKEKGVWDNHDDQNLETEADAWAEEALIPHEIWKEHDVRAYPTALSIINLANTLHIHSAIVAGRIRFEQKSYRLFTQFVGTGQIRSQLDTLNSNAKPAASTS